MRCWPAFYRLWLYYQHMSHKSAEPRQVHAPFRIGFSLVCPHMLGDHPLSIVGTMYLKDWLWQAILFPKVAFLVLNPAHALSSGASNDTIASNDALRCDDSTFGRPLPDSCTEAMEAIPDTTARVRVFGIRPKAHLVTDVVPYRLMSSES